MTQTNSPVPDERIPVIVGIGEISDHPADLAAGLEPLALLEGSAMAKTIVFCADGTWDGPGQTGADDGAAQTTNVFAPTAMCSDVGRPSWGYPAPSMSEFCVNGTGRNRRRC